MTDNNLKIAIQQKGRLTAQSLEFLMRIGLNFEAYERCLYSSCKNFPIDVLYVRDDDIPDYVSSGTVDLGIVGENVINESKIKIKKILPLNFGLCTLTIACPIKMQINKPDDLRNLKIATSYPNCVKKYLLKNNIKAKIIKLAGSVEIAPALNIADCICDLVSTGHTLKMNGLKPVLKVFDSQAYLIANNNFLNKFKKIFINQYAKNINRKKNYSTS